MEHHPRTSGNTPLTGSKDLLQKVRKGRERKDEDRHVRTGGRFGSDHQQPEAVREPRRRFCGLRYEEGRVRIGMLHLDEIPVIRGDGTMIVTKVDDKKYVGKDVRYISVFRCRSLNLCSTSFTRMDGRQHQRE